ncbi:phosphate-starvation-inducible PsiE family protein [Thermocrinis sp.]
METIEEIKARYQWSKEDEENLSKVSWIGEKYKDEFIEELYRYIENFPDINRYFLDKDLRNIHKEIVKKWFALLFSTKYNTNYLNEIYKIGKNYAKTGLPPQYMHTFISFARGFINDKLSRNSGFAEENNKIMASINKALDINLDLMMNSFIEEELRLYFAIGRYQRVLIENIRRVSWFFNAFTVFTLTIVGLFLIVWIIYEVFLILSGKLALEKGGLSILGSILILYAISELLSEEIRHLRGSTLSLKVFVGVALAAVIRKVLIVSLSPEKVEELITLSLVILSLGAVFWLIYKVESKA